MVKKSKKLLPHVVDVEEIKQLMTPQDFKNLPLNNKRNIDPEILMMALRNKSSWDDPDEYGLKDPLVCADLCHTWSNELLIKTNNI